jgi:hypothetical protein
MCNTCTAASKNTCICILCNRDSSSKEAAVLNIKYFAFVCHLLIYIQIIYDGVTENETLIFDYRMEISVFRDVTPCSVDNICQRIIGTCPFFLIVGAAGSFETPAHTFHSTRLRMSDSESHHWNPKSQVIAAGMAKSASALDGEFSRRKVKLLRNEKPT